MYISEKLSSRMDVIIPFISRVMKQLEKEWLLNEEDIFSIKLSLEESLINAIKHGNKFHPDLTMDVQFSFQDDLLVIKIKDYGRGFNSNTIPDPTSDERLMKTSGRGIFLIKKLMDEVSFHDGGREIWMIKKFLHPPQQCQSRKISKKSITKGGHINGKRPKTTCC